jgi:hypothetical protein
MINFRQFSQLQMAEITNETIIQELILYQDFHEIPQPLLEHANKHFYQIMNLLPSQIKYKTLGLILSMDSLILETEDSLFDFIKQQIISHDSSFLDFISHIDLSFLSSSRISEFLELISYNNLTPDIWSCISRRLQNPLLFPLKHSSTHQYCNLFIPKDDIFDGIFSSLNKLSGGNCATNGTISVKASNTHCGNLSIIFVKNDFGQNNFWHHDHIKDGYFEIDFLKRRISLSHYAIHNNLHYVREHDFFKTWTVEGSNNHDK